MMRALGRVSTVVIKPGAVMQGSGRTGRAGGRPDGTRAYKLPSIQL